MRDDTFFLDTNILLYLFDPHEPTKHRRARQLVARAIETDRGCISYQVIQEFLNVVTKKGLTTSNAVGISALLEHYLAPLCRVHSSIDLVHRALDLRERWQYSFYDSLIIAAALQVDCTLLYSEDMQHGQKIQDLTIVNPFVVGP